jgi:hypothetical protein
MIINSYHYQLHFDDRKLVVEGWSSASPLFPTPHTPLLSLKANRLDPHPACGDLPELF